MFSSSVRVLLETQYFLGCKTDSKLILESCAATVRQATVDRSYIKMDKSAPNQGLLDIIICVQNIPVRTTEMFEFLL